MKTGRNYKFWFCTGSQDLYGDECLRKVAEHSRIIVEELNKSGVLPFELVWKPTLITNELIRKHLMRQMQMRTVQVLSHGCILSHRQNHGFLV